MSPAQDHKYWREWGLVRLAILAGGPLPWLFLGATRIVGKLTSKQWNDLRHEFHRHADQPENHMKLTNPQFDKVLEEFWKVSHIDDVAGQMHAATQTRVRAVYTVRSFPAPYMSGICMDKYGTRDPEHLSLEQLCQLAMTLNNRRESIDDREIKREAAIDESLQAEEGIDLEVPDLAAEPELVGTDCPF